MVLFTSGRSCSSFLGLFEALEAGDSKAWGLGELKLRTDRRARCNRERFGLRLGVSSPVGPSKRVCSDKEREGAKCWKGWKSRWSELTLGCKWSREPAAIVLSLLRKYPESTQSEIRECAKLEVSPGSICYPVLGKAI